MKIKSLVSGLIMIGGVMMTVSCVSCHPGRIHFDSSSSERLTEVRPLKGFEKIEISGSPTVYYTQADSFSVKVEGTSEGIENILTEVDNGTLCIRNRGKMGVINVVFDNETTPIIRVCSPDLISVTLNGSGDFISDHRIDTDNMDIVLRGSGDIDVKDLISDRCHIELVGSGDIDVERVDAQEVSVVLIGSGDIDLNLWNVATTSLLLKGSGDIDAEFCEGCQSVDCEIRGSGDINLQGEVSHFSNHKSGSGDVSVDGLTVR